MSRRSLSVALGTFVATMLCTPAGAAPTQPGDLNNPLLESRACDVCHSFSNPIAQADDPAYSPMRTWQGSLMANSARDPVFWAGVAVANDDMPGETETCIRCHAPRAFLDERGDVTSIDQLTLEEQGGVECELCHRAMEDPDTPAGNAMYMLDDTLVNGAVPRRGPWDYSDGVPEPPHPYIYDPYTGSSRMCGTCHDVTTPAERVDDNGEGMGISFNEQRTYSEWLGSDYATPGEGFRSCQDCHMPPVTDMSGCAEHVNQYTHPEGGRRHDMVGANRFVVELIKSQYGSAGSNLLPDQFFDITLEAIDAFLPTSASLDVQPPEEIDLRFGIPELPVTVTNNTGHKLPTGYSEGRIMWLEVTGRYGDQVIYSSGAWDQATGIVPDDQLRTYEAIGEDFADGTTFRLLRNNHWVVDSRIPPLGLRPDIETDPVGDRYTLLPNGTWPNYDTHSYSFGPVDLLDSTPDDTTDNELTLTVRLRYIINTPDYIDFLGDAGGAAGADVAALFDLMGGAPPVTLTEQSFTVPLIGFVSEAGESSSGPGGNSGSTTAKPPAPSASEGPQETTVASGGGSTGPVTSGTTGDRSADGDDNAGCGCQQGRRPTSPALLVLPWLLLGLRRRA